MIRRAALRGDELPQIVVPPPGPRSRGAAKRLRRAEGAAIWGAALFPIVWARAKGSVVLDLDGNRYVDLTSGFGAATLGHAAPEVARAVAAQARRLTQGLGDLHPHALREKLVRHLAPLGGALSQVLLASTGSEAVELAVKTAALATGRRRVVAFEGGYHGQLGAALELTHTPASPERLKPPGRSRAIHIAYPDTAHCSVRRPCQTCDLTCLEQGWEVVERESRGPDPPGAVIVEPVQGRAGVILPPVSFLSRLCAKAHASGLIVIYDEILTGAGRTGPFWGWERSGPAAEPDLITAGKGIGGGVAIGVLFGRPELMEVWARYRPASGESPYASTFYGHPLSCAGALASAERLIRPEMRAAVERKGAVLSEALRRLDQDGAGRFAGRAIGLMGAIEERPGPAGRPERGTAPIWEQLISNGVLTIPGGRSGHALTLLPAYTIAEDQLGAALEILAAQAGRL